MKKIFAIALLILLSSSCNQNIDNKSNPSNIKNSSISVLKLVDSLLISKGDLSILIDKTDYKLYVLADTIILKEYPVVFGTNPIDDKLMEGDRSTPEGQFRVRDYYPHKSWSKFIWINYPTYESWLKHNKAKSDNIIPIDATIGSEIGIHGVPKGKSSLIAEKVNWTWGCISLTNEDIDDLFTIVYKEMRIEIVK